MGEYTQGTLFEDDDAPVYDIGVLGTVEGLALTLAVLHHGLSCLSREAVPAKATTVLQTAETFARTLRP